MSPADARLAGLCLALCLLPYCLSQTAPKVSLSARNFPIGSQVSKILDDTGFSLDILSPASFNFVVLPEFGVDQVDGLYSDFWGGNLSDQNCFVIDGVKFDVVYKNDVGEVTAPDGSLKIRIFDTHEDISPDSFLGGDDYIDPQGTGNFESVAWAGTRKTMYGAMKLAINYVGGIALATATIKNFEMWGYSCNAPRILKNYQFVVPEGESHTWDQVNGQEVPLIEQLLDAGVLDPASVMYPPIVPASQLMSVTRLTSPDLMPDDVPSFTPPSTQEYVIDVAPFGAEAKGVRVTVEWKSCPAVCHPNSKPVYDFDTCSCDCGPFYAPTCDEHLKMTIQWPRYPYSRPGAIPGLDMPVTYIDPSKEVKIEFQLVNKRPGEVNFSLKTAELQALYLSGPDPQGAMDLLDSDLYVNTTEVQTVVEDLYASYTFPPNYLNNYAGKFAVTSLIVREPTYMENGEGEDPLSFKSAWMVLISDTKPSGGTFEVALDSTDISFTINGWSTQQMDQPLDILLGTPPPTLSYSIKCDYESASSNATVTIIMAENLVPGEESSLINYKGGYVTPGTYNCHLTIKSTSNMETTETRSLEVPESISPEESQNTILTELDEATTKKESDKIVQLTSLGALTLQPVSDETTPDDEANDVQDKLSDALVVAASTIPKLDPLPANATDGQVRDFQAEKESVKAKSAQVASGLDAVLSAGAGTIAPSQKTTENSVSILKDLAVSSKVAGVSEAGRQSIYNSVSGVAETAFANSTTATSLRASVKTISHALLLDVGCDDPTITVTSAKVSTVAAKPSVSNLLGKQIDLGNASVILPSVTDALTKYQCVESVLSAFATNPYAPEPSSNAQNITKSSVEYSLYDGSGDEIEVKDQSANFTIIVPKSKDNVAFDLEGDKYQLNYECKWWSEDLNAWAGEGCVVAEITDSAVVCHCNHLTWFAVSMNPIDLTDFSGFKTWADNPFPLILVCAVSFCFGMAIIISVGARVRIDRRQALKADTKGLLPKDDEELWLPTPGDLYKYRETAGGAAAYWYHFSNEHIFFRIFRYVPQSPFTITERVTCMGIFTFMSMAVNSAFYGQSELGWGYWLGNGVVAAGVTTPISLFFALSYQNIDSRKYGSSEPFRRKEYIRIALLFLGVLFCAACAYVTLWYGFDFGEEIAMEWVEAILVALGTKLLVIDPLKLSLTYFIKITKGAKQAKPSEFGTEDATFLDSAAGGALARTMDAPPGTVSL